MSEVKVNKISPRSGTGVQLGDSGDTITIPSGATILNSGTASGFGDNLEWQSSIVTASTITVVANRGYWLDTSSNAITVTLPAAAAVGDRIIFTDYARNWATNAVTINTNSLKFQGNTSPNPVYNTNGQSVDIVYSGTTKGWIPNSDDDVTFETPQFYSADFLVIAGAGGGGQWGGGGGGAGGYRASYNSETSGGGGSSETALSFNPGTVYTITVGAGGAATAEAQTGAQGNYGNDSSISGSDITTITSNGGGRGVHGGDGGDGGSGGGGGYDNTSGGAGTANQGYNGGNGTNTGSPYAGAGAGGAGAAGGNTSGATPGNGGNGVASTITGSSVTRAGGGAGANRSGGAGTGGSGGGGGGTVAGTVNTGSGGGGGTQSPSAAGKAGGSGVVILRMETAKYSGTTSGSPTVSTSGSDTILVYNASGSYTG